MLFTFTTQDEAEAHAQQAFLFGSNVRAITGVLAIDLFSVDRAHIDHPDGWLIVADLPVLILEGSRHQFWLIGNSNSRIPVMQRIDGLKAGTH